jgi:hypothetical protein
LAANFLFLNLRIRLGAPLGGTNRRAKITMIAPVLGIVVVPDDAHSR